MDPNVVLTTAYLDSWQEMEKHGVWEWMELYHPRALAMNHLVRKRGERRDPFIVFTVAEESLLVSFRLYFSDTPLNIRFK